MTPAAYVIRPLGLADRDALAAAFERLSPRSRFRRFLGPKNALSARELTYLVDIDHVTHEAMVAAEPLTGTLIGVARYAINAGTGDSADLAVVVTDAWQGRGVGTALTRRVVERARANGFEHLTGETLSDNEPARALLRKIGFEVVRTSGGVTELELWLRDSTAGSVGPPQWSSVS
jgi:ribosomal protein S18 acetylase RimI-like enzyme